MSFFVRPPSYRAFLLRIWEERGGEGARSSAWRFSLEDPESGKRRGFADVQALTDFLQAELARNAAATEEASEPGRLARLVQSVKETFRPLSESELKLAAAGGEEPAPPEEALLEDDDDEPATV